MTPMARSVEAGDDAVDDTVVARLAGAEPQAARQVAAKVAR